MRTRVCHLVVVISLLLLLLSPQLAWAKKKEKACGPTGGLCGAAGVATSRLCW